LRKIFSQADLNRAA